MVILDHPILEGHVEIEPGQNPRTVEILEITEGRQGHGLSRPTMYSSRSTQRSA